MQQAPAWLSYASPLISLLALVVSGATYWRTSPKVRAWAELYTVKTRTGVQDRLEVRIRNWSSTVVTVRDIAIVKPRESRAFGSPPVPDEANQVGDIGTPHELQGDTLEVWKYNVTGIGDSLSPPFQREWVARLAKLFELKPAGPNPRLSPENNDTSELIQQIIRAEANRIAAYNRSLKARIYNRLTPLRGPQQETAINDIYSKYRVTITLSTGRVVKRRIRRSTHESHFDLSS